MFLILGARANQTMFKQLGAVMDWKNPKLYFDHSCDSSIKIYCLHDPVHMLKLVRNHFESQKIIIDSDGNKIEWQHIITLHEMQVENAVRLGNKLTNAHVNFKNQKMKATC